MQYKVRFVNYPEHYRRLWDETMDTLTQIFTRGDLIMREQLLSFEAHMASYLGVKHAIGLNSGTDALYYSLEAAGIGPGDEVITVAHTFVATVSAIVFCGAKPVLVDIGDDMEMDVDKVEALITPRTKAIIPVHLNGRMVDMGKLMPIAEKHDLIVIEDAAQALGASYNGKRAGSFGLAGCFSFYPAKILGCAGDGGLLATNDDALANKIRLLRDHGLDRETMEMLCFAYNSRLDNLQAALLDVKLRYFPDWLQRRREIARLYTEGLSGIKGLKLPPEPGEGGRYYDVYQNYVIGSDRRDMLAAYLKESGVENLISWPKPLYKHQALGLAHYKLPMTERVSREVLSLPMYPELSDEDVGYVIKCVREFYLSKTHEQMVAARIG